MTAVWDELQPIRVEPERDSYGRYLAVDPVDGKRKAFTRATTIASTMADKYALNLWSQRMTAIGLATRHDLYARVASTSPDDKQTLNRLVEQAKEAAAANAGANLGTALHTFTQRLDLGEDITAPPPWNADLAAYRSALATAGITVLADMVEQVVLLPELKVAGTFDRIVEMAGRSLPLVADLKTGGFLSFDEIAIQLALYAHAPWIWDPVGKVHRDCPRVDQDHALVIHLPAGQATCTLYDVDIAAGWEAVNVAMWVRSWRKRKNLAAPMTTVEVPAVDGGLRAEHARQRLVQLVEREADITWPVGVPSFREAREQDYMHTHDDLCAIEAALSNAEAAIDAPFPPLEPKPGAERVAKMIARLQALPSDLLAVVEAKAAEARVPNLRSARVTIRDLDSLEQIVTPLEAEAGDRAGSVAELLGDLGDDPALANALIALTGAVDVGHVTEAHLQRLEALVSAVDDLVLTCSVTPEGDCAWTAGPKAEEILLSIGDGKAGALTIAKRVAKEHELASPKSFAAALGDPLLSALVTHSSVAVA